MQSVTLPTLLAAAIGCTAVPVLTQPPQYFEIGKLNHPGGANLDQFGHAVARDAGTCLVGAYQWEILFGPANEGTVRTFERQPSGEWSEVGIALTASDGGSFHWFGKEISLDMNAGTNGRALIGAPGDAHAGNFAGSAYIFERDGSGTWREVAKLTASDASSFDFFGDAVALNGDRALVGAENANDNTQVPSVQTGAVYYFERDGTGTWNEVQKFFPPNLTANEHFGTHVAMNETATACVAGCDFGVNVGGVKTGTAHVFTRTGSTWAHSAALEPSDGEQTDEFGTRVGISDSLSGTRVIVGSPTHPRSSGGRHGAIYVYELVAAAWTETHKLVQNGAAFGDEFGRNLDICGDVIAGAAYLDDTAAGGRNAGSVRMFQWNSTTSSWDERAMVEASDGVPSDCFGSDVSLDEDGALVIGARCVTVSGQSHVGRAYIDRYNDGWFSSYGAGTPGCSGAMTAWADRPTEFGMAGFRYTCDNGPPNSIVVGMVGATQDLAGSDPLGWGILFHVGVPGAVFYVTGTNAQGIAHGPAFPVPGPIGATLYGQFFVPWNPATCVLPTQFNFSTSTGFAHTVIGTN